MAGALHVSGEFLRHIPVVMLLAARGWTNEQPRNQFQFQALRSSQNTGRFYLQDQPHGDFNCRYRLGLAFGNRGYRRSLRKIEYWNQGSRKAARSAFASSKLITRGSIGYFIRGHRRQQRMRSHSSPSTFHPFQSWHISLPLQPASFTSQNSGRC
jgi:hypothetical protein